MAQIFWFRPLGPLGGAKRSNIIEFQLLNQFQIFLPNFVCLLTNERYKTCQTGFSFSHLGHAPWVRLLGYMGVGGQKNFLSNFSQIWCVSDSNEWHMQQQNFLVPAPWGTWEQPKGQILNFNY